MSGITLENAQAILDALVEAQAAAAGELMFESVSIAGRTVTFRGAEELQQQINYWSRVVAGLERTAAGESRVSFSVANFQNRQ